MLREELLKELRRETTAIIFCQAQKQMSPYSPETVEMLAQKSLALFDKAVERIENPCSKDYMFTEYHGFAKAIQAVKELVKEEEAR